MRKEIVDLYRERQESACCRWTSTTLCGNPRDQIAGCKPRFRSTATRGTLCCSIWRTRPSPSTTMKSLLLETGGSSFTSCKIIYALPGDEPEGDSMEAVMAFRRRVRDAMVKVTRLHQEAALSALCRCCPSSDSPKGRHIYYKVVGVSALPFFF